MSRETALSLPLLAFTAAAEISAAAAGPHSGEAPRGARWAEGWRDVGARSGGLAPLLPSPDAALLSALALTPAEGRRVGVAARRGAAVGGLYTTTNEADEVGVAGEAGTLW